MEFEFYMPTRVVIGEGVVRDNSHLLAKLGSRCLLVTGHSSARLCGALADVTAALDERKIPWQVFDQVGQNPLISTCMAAGEAARAFGADFLVGIGGGSPLDAVKAAAVFATNPDLAPLDIYEEHPIPALPFALVGTTAGTGSEVTRVAVLTHDATGQKRAMVWDDAYAQVAFGDPKRYTATLSRHFTISTGLDAVCHSVESYFAKTGDAISRACAVEALLLLIPALRTLQEPESMPDPDTRERLYLGSVYAGLGFNRPGNAFPHAMGYVLTEEYGIPHGEACAVFLGEYIENAVREEAQLANRLFGRLGTRKQELIAFVESFLTQVELPVLSEERLEALLDRWDGNSNMARTPGDFSREKQKKAAKAVLQRR